MILNEDKLLVEVGVRSLSSGFLASAEARVMLLMSAPYNCIFTSWSAADTKLSKLIP